MKVYRVTYDGGANEWFIEAESMGQAIAIWHVEAKKMWGDDYQSDDEPEQVALLGDGPVLRAE